MRRNEKQRIRECISTLFEAHGEIKEHIKKGNYRVAKELTGQCQESAIQVGTFIESREGEGFVTVGFLEKYCEHVYLLYEKIEQGLRQSKTPETEGLLKEMHGELRQAAHSVKNDVPERIEVVFLPYKASMWDSFESIWQAADADPDCDAYVVPIPYYDRNPGGSCGQYHYEGGQFPDYVPVVHYEHYSLEKRHPDIIYIHNPYDGANYVTSVDPQFYSEKLKNYTECLVYVPYFLFPKSPEPHLINTPVLQNADCIVVQNEQVKDAYIREIEMHWGSNKRIKDNVFAVGTPKTDKIYNICKNGADIPEKWITLAQGRKKMFMNTNVSLILNNNEKFIDNLTRVFQILNRRGDVFVIWREHPLTYETLKSMRPGMLEAYNKLKLTFVRSGLGVLDTNVEAHAAMCFSDCYFGAGGSLAPLYAVTGKPMLLTAYNYPDNIRNYEASFATLLKQSERSMFFSEKYVNSLDLFLDNLEVITKDKGKRFKFLSQITLNIDGTAGSKIMNRVKSLLTSRTESQSDNDKNKEKEIMMMKNEAIVKKIFRDYIKETFHDEAENLKIYIFGMQLQICGGILKFEDELDITLMEFDLRYTGYQYSGHICKLPEMCMPFPENAVVLVSCIYPYQFEKIRSQLVRLGVGEERIAQARTVSEKILETAGAFFSQNAMDQKVKTLFEGIGKSLSEIQYIDIGANTWLLYNNSYLFYRAGSNGVLVEANPDFVESIKENRPRDKAVMCGCSDAETDEEWTYYKTPHAGYNTFVKEIADKYVKKGLPVEEIKVPMKDIGSILDENFPSGHIDYMSIDVEGMGVRIVDAIDFNRYRIDVILLEMDFNKEESRKLYMKLLDLGYASRYRGIGAAKDFLFFRTSVFGADIL